MPAAVARIRLTLNADHGDLMMKRFVIVAVLALCVLFAMSSLMNHDALEPRQLTGR